MPTGYTKFIEDGEIKSGDEFLMLCARAMGACVSMRDEPLSNPIPKKFTECDYYYESLIKAEKEIKRLEEITLEEAQKELDAAYEKRQKNCQEAIRKAKGLKKDYDNIRRQVAEWEPPTAQHTELKKFALEQVDISYVDTDFSYYEKLLTKPKKTAAEWLKSKIRQNKERADHFRQELQKEQTRILERNLWLKQLRESLNKSIEGAL